MRPASEAASCPLPLRSAQSLSEMKPIAMFCPEPAKLKPETLTKFATSSFMEVMTPLAIASVASVRSLVAPGGSCAMTMSAPWSSLGKNEVGMRVYSHSAPTVIARYSPTSQPMCRMERATVP